MTPRSKPKPNGWIRIGIVLSIAWLLFVGGATLFEFLDHRPDVSNFIEWRVPKTGETYAALVKSTGEFSQFVPLSASLRPRWFFVALLAPVILFWVLAFMLVYTVRWIFHGFRPKQV